MPFLRLTRDRRGYENTYLMHADRPGDRPRILYWYRTAPGITQGRPPLDEDAIRTIEDQHPAIDFDWPAILALSEVMTPEDEAPAPKPQREKKRPQQSRREREGGRRDDRAPEHRRGPEDAGQDTAPADAQASPFDLASAADAGSGDAPELADIPEIAEPRNRLVEELAGREIGARLRARHAEIVARIAQIDVDGAEKDALFKRAEAIDPELWMTPESVLDGVRNADALFEKLRDAVGHSSRE